MSMTAMSPPVRNLLTPISSPIDGFGLVYKKISGETASYDYRRGEAIVFGDHCYGCTAGAGSSCGGSLT